MRTQYTAYCFASGQIEFGITVPDGALALAKGAARPLKQAVEVLARHGYEPGVLLVPGVPEARSFEEAKAAVVRFVTWARHDREKSMWRHPDEVAQDIDRLTATEEA